MSYLQIKNVGKSFFGVEALKDISFNIELGEIHVVIGENGAGKSTLMKIIAGLYHQDKGEIILKGEQVQINSPIDAIGKGIAMIHQELMPVPYLTVAENVFLGREPKTKLGLVDRKQMFADTKKLLDEMKIPIQPEAEMRTLSVAQIQLVEIAKAVSYNSELLIMDEPTSAISDREVDNLCDLVFRLKAQNKAIVFISHKLDEIFRVADRITVLRDGEYIGTKNKEELTRDGLIQMMIGRELKDVYEKRDCKPGKVIFEVENLCKAGKFDNISFNVREGEVLGIAGLMGAGRTEVCEAIFGLNPADSGTIKIDGKKVSIRSTKDAIEHKIALVPEDRKELGLNLKDSTGFNISLSVLKNFVERGMIRKDKENKAVDEAIETFNVKVQNRKTPVVSLSGGNQQKVVIAKWMLSNPNILILDEPTRGIDIGAKTEIYKLINQFAKEGKAVIMVSSELPEVIGMSDRVMVLSEGMKTGMLSGDEINQMEIMKCATIQRESF
ncbi:MAG: sugar ABC transporter ATP-binding protein [Lachnospiraceae bacterium]|nr:sugar ABC transporter ATP-binding protein [Lachnospiraceae bacterium]